MNNKEKKQKQADLDYINKYCLENARDIFITVNSFPKDGNFEARMQKLRVWILGTRDNG